MRFISATVFSWSNHGRAAGNHCERGLRPGPQRLINSGYAFPAKKITINLAPADLPKKADDTIYPSPALLVASEQLNTTRLNQYEFVGELALNSGLRGVCAIPSAMEAIAPVGAASSSPPTMRWRSA
ncbi:hypothetical protein MJ584_01285 [Klebsiella pneumoniae]|nr:hypothetical protein MJ584_01285 [Klebsiella pneumoniae]